MWRITIFIMLLCSIATNVYLFLKLNEKVINTKVSPYQTKMFVKKPFPHHINSSSEYDEQPLSVKIKSAIQTNDYFLASFLIKSLQHNKDCNSPHN